MPPRPRRTITRKTDDAHADRVGDRAVVAKSCDPRQPRLFDAPLPGWMRLCLPTLVDAPPMGAQWVHEIKWDGYRVSAYFKDGKATVRTRNGHDWTRRFPTIAAAVARLPVRSAVIDGEAVISSTGAVARPSPSSKPISTATARTARCSTPSTCYS